MPGHRVSQSIFDVDHSGALFRKYKCPSCKHLLRDAVQPSCGHWLCQSCAEELFQIAGESLPKCPREDCNEELTGEDGVNYFPDRFVRREILNMKVLCINHEKGCDWMGKFASYASHLAECSFNQLQCQYCKRLFAGQQELEIHQHSCTEVAMQCPLAKFGCPTQEKMMREALLDHLSCKEGVITHWELVASMLEEGGPKTNGLLPRPQTVGWSEDDALASERLHDLIETDGATAHKFRVPVSSHPVKVTSLPLLSSEVSPHGMVIQQENLQKVIAFELQEATRLLREELDEAMQNELKKKDKEIMSLQATVTKLEKSVRAKNAEIEDRDFRLSLIENSSYNGSMVWKIPQFSQRMADAQSGKYTSIFSLPFYTGRYGYKMCLRLYILGDGIGKNTHMSLFFVIMRGEFDNILLWPFTHRVTFRLINQVGGRDIMDTFQPDPMSSSFRKPEKDMNVASGCPRFISHLELKNGGFIVEDTVFIKCTIDISTIKHP